MTAAREDLPDGPEPVSVEIRCPYPVVKEDGQCRPGQLFTVLRLAGEQPTFVQPGNLIEMACLDCKRQANARGERTRRVLHRYDFAGTLIETLHVKE